MDRTPVPEAELSWRLGVINVGPTVLPVIWQPRIW